MYPSVSGLRQTATLGLLLFVQMQFTVSPNIPISAQEAITATNLLRGVSARDTSWYPVLNELLTVNRENLDPHVIRMLDITGVKGSEMKAYQVINHLVTNPGATGSELNFGVQTLGTALTCQITKTVAVHMFFALEYAKRSSVLVADVRWCISKIQMALPGYLDKLSAFKQPINHLVKMNEHMNEAFDTHDVNDKVNKEEFVAHLVKAQEPVKKHLTLQCGGVSSEQEMVKTVQMSSFSESIFINREAVGEDRLLEMIEDLNDYRYVDVVTGMQDADFWTDRLRIKKYELKISGFIPIEDTVEEEEVEEE